MRENRGLTLIELIITIGLISVLLGAIWVVCNTGLKVFYNQWARVSLKGEAGRLSINMANELRQAGSITSAQQKILTFTVDLNGDGAIETIQYSWSGVSGDPFIRTQTAPLPQVTKQVLRSVNALAFSYYGYDQNITPLSFPVTLSNVKLVAIDVTAADENETFQLRTKVRLASL